MGVGEYGGICVCEGLGLKQGFFLNPHEAVVVPIEYGVRAGVEFRLQLG